MEFFLRLFASSFSRRLLFLFFVITPFQSPSFPELENLSFRDLFEVTHAIYSDSQIRSHRCCVLRFDVKSYKKINGAKGGIFTEPKK
jgi:hypothetical protein